MRTLLAQVSRRDRRRASWIRAAGAALVLALSVGCGARAAEKLLDPRLRETGELLEREGRGRTRVFGPYRVAGLERSEELSGAEISTDRWLPTPAVARGRRKRSACASVSSAVRGRGG